MSAAVQLAHADLEMALTATLCLGCGGAKREREALCGACFRCLPIFLLEWLTAPRTEYFADNFRRAVRHLVAIRATRKRWPYRSLDELERAGFQRSSEGQCNSPRCLMVVLWVRTPQGGRMPVDPRTVAPHGIVCKDPVGVTLLRIRRMQPVRRKRRA